MSGDHHHGAANLSDRHRRPLAIAFALTAGYMVAEVVGGLVTGSLALLSDAAHMGTDVVGLGMALAAVVAASRNRSSHRTYGAYRLEVLAALANGMLLFGVAGWVLWEAIERFRDPQEVGGWQLALIATGGLIVNLISFRMLRGPSTDSINVRGAYLEVLGDLLGSVAVIIGALIIVLSGWNWVDPVLGAAIGLFILPRTFLLSRQALRILMEAAPPGVDVVELRRDLRAIPGVVDAHDVHVWTITSGLDAATGHVVVADEQVGPAVLMAATQLIRDKYGISHVTVQTEPVSHEEPREPCLSRC